MTRINPITMIDAYLYTAILPTASSEFIYADIHGTIRACPMAVIALAGKRKGHDEIWKYANFEGGLNSNQAFIRVMCDGIGQWSEVYGIIRKALDISRAYMHGFMWGYDRWPLEPLDVEPDHPDYELGYWDGGICKAVLEERDYKIYLS